MYSAALAVPAAGRLTDGGDTAPDTADSAHTARQEHGGHHEVRFLLQLTTLLSCTLKSTSLSVQASYCIYVPMV